MPRERSRLRSHAFHQVAIADDRISRVVDHLESGTVVARRELRFGNRHADRIGESLPERAGRDLHTWRVAALGMSRRFAAKLAELLDVVERNVVTGQMQQTVKQHRTVSGGEHEAVAIEPVGIAWIVFEQPRPQRVRHRRCAERHARMPALRILHRVHR